MPRASTLSTISASLVASIAITVSATSASAQGQPQATGDRPPYGVSINLETAKRLVAASEAEARKNNWRMAISVVDTHGLLVFYEMMDDTQTGSVNVSMEKAKTAAMFRRPSKEFEDNVAGGRVAIVALPGVTPIEGGIPIVVGGKIVGAVGVSGGSSAQDGQVAKAGTDAVARP